MSREVDVEKQYDKREVAAKLRRLADALEQGKAFEFEYERDGDEEEIEIEVKWTKG